MVAEILGFFAPIGRGQTNEKIFGPFIKIGIFAPSDKIVCSSEYIATQGEKALVDSGSERSTIRNSFAHKIGLPVANDKIGMYGASGMGYNKSYDAKLCFGAQIPTISAELIGQPLPEDMSSFSVIIGMDILRFFSVRLSRKDNLVQLLLER